MVLAEVWEQWWMGNKIELRDITVSRKEAMYHNHIAPYFGSTPIEKVDDLMINAYVVSEMTSGNRLSGKPLNNNTINKNLDMLRSILEYARIKGYITFNPMSLVKRLSKTPTRTIQIYTPEEVEELVNRARPKWMGSLIQLAYHTGMRKGECFGLQWGDINFQEKWLKVKRSVSATKPGEKLINPPKTSKGMRIIYLDDNTVDMLQNRYEKRTSDTWVFASKVGELLSPWYTVKYFIEARKKAGILYKTFHDLRHTHITELVAAGHSIPVIQQRVGHSDLSMTMHYTHIKPDMQEDIVIFMNERSRSRSKQKILSKRVA